MHRLLFAFSLTVLTGCAPDAVAEGGEGLDTLTPYASVLDFTGGAGFGVAAGISTELGGRYDGSDRYEFGYEPGVVAHWRRGEQMLAFDGQELGWRGVLGDENLLQVLVRFEPGRTSSDFRETTGLADADDEIAGTVEYRRFLGARNQFWLGGRWLGGDANLGHLGILAGGFGYEVRAARLQFELIGFTTFATSTFQNRDFGVTTAESARTGLPATDIAGGYRAVGFTALARWDVLSNVSILAELGAERYATAIADSPIARDAGEAELGFSLLYRWP